MCGLAPSGAAPRQKAAKRPHSGRVDFESKYPKAAVRIQRWTFLTRVGSGIDNYLPAE